MIVFVAIITSLDSDPMIWVATTEAAARAKADKVAATVGAAKWESDSYELSVTRKEVIQ